MAEEEQDAQTREAAEKRVEEVRGSESKRNMMVAKEMERMKKDQQ